MMTTFYSRYPHSYIKLHIYYPRGAHIRSASGQSPYARVQLYSTISGKNLTYAPTRSVLDTAPPNTEYPLPPILHQRYLRKRFS